MTLIPEKSSAKVKEICTLAPVIPVLVVQDPQHARPLAEALIRGGLPALEVTLRTGAALEVIREMSEIEGGVVGAGTLLTPEDLRAAKDAGALFGVSPGATDRLLEASEEEELPLLPGAATASEAMRLAERGYEMPQVFSGKSGRRSGDVALACRPAAPDQFLPDRRGRP